ncbi:dTDP-4-dehydrorhamnose 3,5-epimerase family protein [Thalassospira sp. UBA1131]|uniref:dTDP-4-dehydrorhamnose 3,5-epimerase family protein n=1 Tax=Thalassospira sp. UBA1131 TaxID=1947672 RepID=UPI0025FEFC6F|nr:dTDP-4-dehydrorhamnose 3,5-epimerase family protein [Thalassospira sp. UBA1131]
MSRFEIHNLPLAGVSKIVRSFRGDERGFLSRLYCSDEFEKAGWDTSIAQINHTLTSEKGTVRGLHFQRPPYSEKKLVTCLHGEIWDVVVDIRRDSSAFLQWHGEKISSERGEAILIPEGFAHGFQTLTDDVELIYLHSAPYEPASEDGLNPDDPELRIKWPLPCANLSKRDKGHPMIDEHFSGIKL